MYALATTEKGRIHSCDLGTAISGLFVTNQILKGAEQVYKDFLHKEDNGGCLMIIEEIHSLEISTTIGCRLFCEYCPQHIFLKAYKDNFGNDDRVFTFENFKKVLSKMQKSDYINFSGMSEPFLNPQCADMILYAYQMGFNISLNTTLVGMTEDDLDKIKEVKFSNLMLHIPDEEQRAKFDVNDEYLRILDGFKKTFKIDRYSCHGTLHPILRKKYPGLSVSPLKPMDRAGNLKTNGLEIPSYDFNGRITCRNGNGRVGQFTPVVLPNGELILCCMDYSIQHKLGNLLKMSWEEIIKSENWNTVFKAMEDETLPLLCRKCAAAVSVESLPAFRLKKMLEQHKKSVLNQSKIHYGGGVL